MYFNLRYAKCFNSSSTIVGAFYNCTGSTFFNPNMQLCSTTYTCQETTTTTEATAQTTTETTTETTTRTTTSAPTSAQSICDSEGVAGRYPNPDDTTCQQLDIFVKLLFQPLEYNSHRYAYCFESNSSLVGSYYNCTGTTLFNPSLQMCDNGYQCSS